MAAVRKLFENTMNDGEGHADDEHSDVSDYNISDDESPQEVLDDLDEVIKNLKAKADTKMDVGTGEAIQCVKNKINSELVAINGKKCFTEDNRKFTVLSSDLTAAEFIQTYNIEKINQELNDFYKPKNISITYQERKTEDKTVFEFLIRLDFVRNSNSWWSWLGF